MVRIGIIGAGKICQGPHMGAYDKIDNAEIVAICDIDEKKLDSVKNRYPNASLYKDYKEMINNEKLDAVDICTPNNMHSIIAIYALNSGLNVICEKPDAINAAEAEKMISTWMGDNVEARKKYITANANFNKVDKFEERIKK